ncbi:E3 ubiquitin-protein ligase KEG [Lactuca sativa]|uniref:Protein kinase domain-containing protein n=1 Tax=Lactuca sativa TaxID=4236 RepID=A0A9R1X4R2_LACSA|nr:E3 ubiquitin-protein ligase KEG [Lactuca sativa]KAJ0200695.1 hypothetical protein LSAT_V11C600306820 [Lactuca sativa]
MAAKLLANRASTSFDFEIVDNDYDQLTTNDTSNNNPWINPASIKLRHRLGRGPFGDVWLATRHQVTEDYEEYHEVAVKMLHHIKEDNIKVVLDKLSVLLSKSQGLQGASCLHLHGVSVITGKICIIMKFYEGSIGDKMATLKGGKCCLGDVLRYGIDLAHGIMELHSKEILILNLKPNNILLNEEQKAILGDLGIPYVLLGVPLPLTSSDMTRRIGTPNYMAPEQWQPDIRGPLSFETDSWGFGCIIVEMLTGVKPWCGKSIDEIYNSVVKRQEKPHIPDGLLPPAVENVILGCFEYDFRSRPLMADILMVFQSSKNAIFDDGKWKNISGPGPTSILEKSNLNGYTKWFLSKSNLEVGDTVRSRKPLNSCKHENMVVPVGTIVGLDTDNQNQNGYVLVRVHGIHDPVRVHGSTLERVTYGLSPGDWIRFKEENKKRNSNVGIVHTVDRDGSLTVGVIGIETLWKCVYSDVQMAENYCVGEFVRVKRNVFSPRFEWVRKRGGEWGTGRVFLVLPNGCLVVKFPGRLNFSGENDVFMADPGEVELVSFGNNMVKKYWHLEDFHWGVRPFLVSLGVFTVVKLGVCVGGKMRVKKNEKSQSEREIGNAKWLPTNMANIIFREGVNITNTTR